MLKNKVRLIKLERFNQKYNPHLTKQKKTLRKYFLAAPQSINLLDYANDDMMRQSRSQHKQSIAQPICCKSQNRCQTVDSIISIHCSLPTMHRRITNHHMLIPMLTSSINFDVVSLCTSSMQFRDINSCHVVLACMDQLDIQLRNEPLLHRIFYFCSDAFETSLDAASDESITIGDVPSHAGGAPRLPIPPQLIAMMLVIPRGKL